MWPVSLPDRYNWFIKVGYMTYLFSCIFTRSECGGEGCLAAPPSGPKAERRVAFCLAPMEGVTPEISGQSDGRTSGRHFVLREESLSMIATIVIFLIYCRNWLHSLLMSARTD